MKYLLLMYDKENTPEAESEEEMQKWFARNMPSVKIVLRRTRNGWMGDDAALRKEIVEKGAAGAVIGIGG